MIKSTMREMDIHSLGVKFPSFLILRIFFLVSASVYQYVDCFLVFVLYISLFRYPPPAVCSTSRVLHLPCAVVWTHMRRGTLLLPPVELGCNEGYGEAVVSSSRRIWFDWLPRQGLDDLEKD